MTSHVFTTPSGTQVPAITTAQMREVDRVAVDEYGPNLYQMMENAGRNLAELCVHELGHGWTRQRIVVAAGTGGNGGGGICAARHLANHGGDVTVVVTDPARLRGVPAEQLAMFRHTAGRIADAAQAGSLLPDLVVDAVLGYSLSGSPRGVVGDLIAWMAGSGAPIISLDVPSGIDSTSGLAPGDFVSATTTMTLALPKQGLDVPAVGRLWLADLGIPRDVYRRVGIRVPEHLFAHAFRVALDSSRPTPFKGTLT